LWIFSQNTAEELEKLDSKIATYKSEENKQLELEYLNKAAFLSWDNQLYEKSQAYFKRILEINESLNNTNGILLAANYLGVIYNETQDYTSAITYFKKAYHLSKKINDKKNICSSLLNISQTYQLQKNYDESNKSAFEGVNLSKELNDLKMLRSFYGILANNYQSLGNSEKSIEYFDLFASIDKYIKTQEIKQIKEESETEITKAQQEKALTQQELIKQTDRLKITEDSLAVVEELSREQKMQLELEESKNRELEAQLKFERLWRNILIWGIIIVLGFLGILLVLYKKIKSQKIQIEDQRDKLELQNKKINDSIHYAQNIQRAILPLNNQIKEVFENFIIYKPKDIVSGDFYWFGKTNNTIFLAVVDCTGHGVPGAFMSMIGNSLLNEIILEKKLQDPAKILTLLNEKVIDALRQNESDNNDGMDVCLVSFEINSKLVKFSGAKRPLYVSRKNNEIEEIKGTRKSIGGKKEGIEDFSSVEIKLESGDILYLSSDGLTDQNNKERKRFGSNKLKEILQLNIDQSMENQKLAIEKELDIFMENEEQRDDITLIGIKIN